MKRRPSKGGRHAGSFTAIDVMISVVLYTEHQPRTLHEIAAWTHLSYRQAHRYVLDFEERRLLRIERHTGTTPMRIRAAVRLLEIAEPLPRKRAA